MVDVKCDEYAIVSFKTQTGGHQYKWRLMQNGYNVAESVLFFDSEEEAGDHLKAFIADIMLPDGMASRVPGGVK